MQFIRGWWWWYVLCPMARLTFLGGLQDKMSYWTPVNPPSSPSLCIVSSAGGKSIKDGGSIRIFDSSKSTVTLKTFDSCKSKITCVKVFEDGRSVYTMILEYFRTVELKTTFMLQNKVHSCRLMEQHLAGPRATPCPNQQEIP